MRGKLARELRRATDADSQPCPSNRDLIWIHTKDVVFLLLCEMVLALGLIAVGHVFPELQTMVDAVRPVLEVSAGATVGYLAADALARMSVTLWIELSGRVKRREKSK